MIHIKQSQTADTRSAQGSVDKETLLASSYQHINDVRKAMRWMADMLIAAAGEHDYTKIENIDEFHADFKLMQAGGLADFKAAHWFHDLHLKERHHLTDRCPDDVNLFDVLERIADITMAGMGRTGNIYKDELPPEMLARAYQNTIELLKGQIVVEALGAQKGEV